MIHLIEYHFKKSIHDFLKAVYNIIFIQSSNYFIFLRISRFGNFLCNVCLAPSTDPAVIELAAKALARLTQVSGTYTTNLKFQLITHEVKRAFEVLQSPGNNNNLA